MTWRCKAHPEVEEFAVFLDDELDPDGIGVLVGADGTVTNRWADGTAGVPAEIARFAALDDDPHCTECWEVARWEAD